MIVNKLTGVQAYGVFISASLAHILCAPWSFGEALFNVLYIKYPELADQIADTKDDFFYVKDADEAYRMFYESCVIKEEK